MAKAAIEAGKDDLSTTGPERTKLGVHDIDVIVDWIGLEKKNQDFYNHGLDVIVDSGEAHLSGVEDDKIKQTRKHYKGQF